MKVGCLVLAPHLGGQARNSALYLTETLRGIYMGIYQGIYNAWLARFLQIWTFFDEPPISLI